MVHAKRSLQYGSILSMANDFGQDQILQALWCGPSVIWMFGAGPNVLQRVFFLFSFFGLAYFIYHNALTVQPFCHRCQDLLLSHGRIIFPCININHIFFILSSLIMDDIETVSIT